MALLQQLKERSTASHHDELFVKRPVFGKRGTSGAKATLQLGEAQPTDDLVAEDNHLAVGSQVGALEQRLTHLMNLVEVQRWMWAEFALSFIDEPIVNGTWYDLSRLMEGVHCRITARCMPRRYWQMVRQVFGKPRRFSQSFIDHEMADWQFGREQVRQLQQGTFQRHKDSEEPLPSRIPMPLPMDAKVTAFLQKGFGHGVVVKQEPKNNTYLVKLSIGDGAKTWLHLPDTQLQGELCCESLPLSIMMAVSNKPKPREVVVKLQKDKEKKEQAQGTFSRAGYSQTLLESVVTVKNLLSIKRKTVRDFTALNKDFELLTTAQASGRRDNKPERDAMQRRVAAHMITLHRVNDDLLEPLRDLHQFLHEYKDVEDQKGKTLSACECFQQCRLQADLDLKSAETQLGLVVKSDATRDLIRTLHTLLYLFGALSGENGADIRTIIDDILASTMENLPPVLGAHFKQMIGQISPICESFGRGTESPQEQPANEHAMAHQETTVQSINPISVNQDMDNFDDTMEPMLYNLFEL
ncbi:blast:Protein lin-9 homolog [Drosophila guanche]|nr:blast:Protein lin-9 homolog [Drosophila guanche]